MKKNSILILVLLATTLTHSQSYFSTIQYNKNTQPALRLDMNNNPKDVNATILEKLTQEGYKPETEGHLFWKENTIDGFFVFNNITLPSLGAQKLDMYFKVVQRNEDRREFCSLYLLVSTGNENFASPEQDTALWNRAKAFLNGFIDNTTAYILEEEIKKSENLITTSQKNLSELQKDQKDLEAKIRQFENELRENQNSQMTKRLEIEDHKKSLEDLKLKRQSRQTPVSSAVETPVRKRPATFSLRQTGSDQLNFHEPASMPANHPEATVMAA